MEVIYLVLCPLFAKMGGVRMRQILRKEKRRKGGKKEKERERKRKGRKKFVPLNSSRFDSIKQFLELEDT